MSAALSICMRFIPVNAGERHIITPQANAAAHLGVVRLRVTAHRAHASHAGLLHA